MAAKQGIFKTNAGNKTGRPQRGFEAYRKKALDAKPKDFAEYMQDIFKSIEKDNGDYTLGIIDEGNVWHEYKRGMFWTHARIEIPGKKLIYVSYTDLDEGWKVYEAEFEKRRLAIAFN